MIADLLDQTLVERMIMGFREDEFIVPAFEKVSCEREANCITWEFTMDIRVKTHLSEFHGMFDGEQVIAFTCDQPYILVDGDRLNLTYTLHWSGGGGGGGHVSLPPASGKGLEQPMTFWSTCA